MLSIHLRLGLPSGRQRGLYISQPYRPPWPATGIALLFHVSSS
jgi:hypothetical protein